MAQLPTSLTVENLPKTTPWLPQSIIQSFFDDSGSRSAWGHSANISHCWAQVGAQRRGWTWVTSGPCPGVRVVGEWKEALGEEGHSWSRGSWMLPWWRRGAKRRMEGPSLTRKGVPRWAPPWLAEQGGGGAASRNLWR